MPTFHHSEASLNYETRGTGSPLLLLNGLGLDLSGWGPHAEALSRSHRVVLLDAPDPWVHQLRGGGAANTSRRVARVEQVAPARADALGRAARAGFARLYRSQPLQEGPDLAARLLTLLDDPTPPTVSIPSR